jgi:hypothetical protein
MNTFQVNKATYVSQTLGQKPLNYYTNYYSSTGNIIKAQMKKIQNDIKRRKPLKTSNNKKNQNNNNTKKLMNTIMLPKGFWPPNPKTKKSNVKKTENTLN